MGNCTSDCDRGYGGVVSFMMRRGVCVLEISKNIKIIEVGFKEYMVVCKSFAMRMHAMRARCACHATTYHGRCPTSSTCLRTSTAARHTAPHERPGAGRYSPQCGDLVAAGRLGPGACRPFVCLPASVPPPPRHGRAPFERAAPPAAPSASPSATASASAAPPLATLRHCLRPRLRCAGGCQTPTISSRMT